MSQNVMNESIARRFLLGDLPLEERERVEELAFDDPETFALMQSAQDDLIDDFVNGELSPEERERFQNYFLAQPGRRQDLRIGRALQQYLARDEQPAPNTATNVVVPGRRFWLFDWVRLHPATVSLAVLLLVGIGLLPVLTRRGGDDPQGQAQNQPTPALPTPSGSPVDTPVQTSPSPTPTQNVPAPSPHRPVGPIYAVLVPGGPTRSEGEEVKVPPAVTPVSFELPIIDNTPYQHYEASLQRSGKTIRRWSNLRPRELQSGTALRIEVPAGLLDHRQHYRIVVTGFTDGGKNQPVHTYYFQVSN